MATSGPTRRQTPRCSTSWPPSSPARTSSRTKRTLPWLAVHSSVTVLASTGPRRIRCTNVSTAARSRSSRSIRRTRALCHSDSRPRGTLSVERTVATRKSRSASTSWPTSVADVLSRRWRSSTKSTSGPVPDWSWSTERICETTATRSHRSSPSPAGRRWASAPSGTSHEPSVAVARATLRPAWSARARHWSARRVLPTPGGPWMTKPWARGSVSVSENSSSSWWRPTRGHCSGGPDLVVGGRASPGHRDHRTGRRGQPSPRPPSTTRRWPVTKPAASLAKKLTAWATSSTPPNRPIGTVAR